MESSTRKVYVPYHLVRDIRESEKKNFGGIVCGNMQVEFLYPNLEPRGYQVHIGNDANWTDRDSKLVWKLEAQACAYCGGNAYFTPYEQPALAWHEFCTCGD